MPALLAKFRPVPPLVRARASELLDVIRDAVKSYSEVASRMVVDAEEIVETEVVVDNAKVVPPAVSEPSGNVTSLWNKKAPGSDFCQSEQNAILTSL